MHIILRSKTPVKSRIEIMLIVVFPMLFVPLIYFVSISLFSGRINVFTTIFFGVVSWFVTLFTTCARVLKLIKVIEGENTNKGALVKKFVCSVEGCNRQPFIFDDENDWLCYCVEHANEKGIDGT